MQNKKLTLRMVGIPTEMLDKAGITAFSDIEIIQFKDLIVICKAEDTAEYDCDTEWEDCPFFDMECDDNCEYCPDKDICEDYIESEEK